MTTHDKHKLETRYYELCTVQTCLMYIFLCAILACPAGCMSCYMNTVGKMRCAVCEYRFTLKLDQDGCLECPQNCHKCYIDEEGNMKCYEKGCKTGYALRKTNGISDVYDCKSMLIIY